MNRAVAQEEKDDANQDEANGLHVALPPRLATDHVEKLNHSADEDDHPDDFECL